MEYQKPLTQNIKDKANKLYFYLKAQGDYVSKEQIAHYLGMKDERSAREIVAVLATKKPIISHSGNKGYKLAQTESDLDEVEHTWAELSSRMEEIARRIAPLIDFRDKIRFGAKKP